MTPSLLPPFVDWTTHFYPVCLGLKSGHYPPWTYALLSPLTSLPPHLGAVLLALLSILISIRYLGWRSLFFLTCAPVVISIGNGNIDTLLLAAFLLPLSGGLIIASCKPVVMIGWMVRKVTSRGLIHGVPLALLLTLSLILWGLWPLHANTTIDHLVSKYDISLFPYLSPLGLIFLLSNNPLLWLVGGCFLSPYLAFYQLTPILGYWMRRAKLWQIGIVWVGSWAGATVAWG